MIRLFEHRSLEKEIISPLREFIESVGISEKYANFFKEPSSSFEDDDDERATIRVSTAHPFAVLLFQSQVQNRETHDFTNLFPAITVVDSYGTETDEELGRGFEEGVLSTDEFATILSKEDIVTHGLQLDEVESLPVTTPRKVPFRKWTITSQRNVDFNIWGENHDLVSIIYDMVESFAVTLISVQEETEDYILSGSITGRRSGDINVEFGKVLYGANVTVPMKVRRDVMEFFDAGDRVSIIRGVKVKPNLDFDCL